MPMGDDFTEISKNDVIAAVIKMVQYVRENTTEMNGKTESLSTEIEDIKKKQMEIYKWKNTITEIKTHQGRSIAEWRW